MTTVATDLVHAATRYYGPSGLVTYHGLTKLEYAAAVIMDGLCRDNDNIVGLTDGQIADIVKARAVAALLYAGAVATDLAFPPNEFRNPALPAASRQNGLTKLENDMIRFMSGFQGDNLNIDTLNPTPTAPTDTLKAVAGLMEHITVPTAPTAALATVPIAGNVNLMTVPTAPTAALAGAGAGNVDHCTVPTAPTHVEGAAGLVDIGDHWYTTTFVTADGETSMGAISAAATTIAAATKHITVTVPTGGANVLSRNVYRSKIGGAHVARTDFFLVGAIADNVTATLDDNLAEAGMPATNPPATNTAYKYKYVVTYVALDATETSMGAVQAAGVASTDKTADGKVTVTIPVSAEAGGGTRNIYRCAGGLAASATLRTHFFLVGAVADNTTLTFTDNVSEAARATGANPPAANGTGKHKYIVTFDTLDGETTMGAISTAVTVADASVNGQISLTAIPVSTQPGVTQRNVYRSKAGVVPTLRTHFFKVATIANNTATTLTDNTADSGLGANPPAASTAASYTYKTSFVTLAGESEASAASGGVIIADKTASGQCDLTDIDTGPVGTTARKLYRTKAGFGSVGPWYYHSTVAGNATTIAVDNTPDSGLTTTILAPTADQAWAGVLAYDVADKAAKFETELGSTGSDPIVPYRFSVVSGAVVMAGQTKEEFFAQAAESGFISDSVNIGAHTNAQISTHASTLATALITALNTP